MREIKFRVFDKTTEEMYFPGEDGTQLVLGATDDMDDAEKYMSLWCVSGEICSGEDAVFLQYTGLKDKNGREIYEGDILKIESSGNEPLFSQVVWGGMEYPAFDLPKYDGYGMNAFSAIRHDSEETLEVIGNIHDNPELLEVAE